MKLNDNDELKALTLLSKPYLEETYLADAKDDVDRAFKDRLKLYKEHLIQMVKQKSKFEVEALSCQADANFLDKNYSDQLVDLI